MAKVIKLDKTFFGRAIIYLLLAVVFFYAVRSVYVVLKIKFYKNDAVADQVLDRNGKLLFERPKIDKGYSDYRELKDINPYLINGVIALEDKNFRRNIGIDIPRILKCTYETLLQGNTCGASTITQQYVKLEMGSQNRTFVTKIDEIVLSLALNSLMSKDEIIERYLNLAYFGNLRYGVNSASKGYFNIDNNQLTLAQSTFLIAIPNSPNQFDPYTKIENTISRQKLVLDAMLKEEYITQDEYEHAIETPIEVGSFYNNIEAPHFVNYVSQISDDPTIKTSIDLELYREVLQVVREHMTKLKEYNATNASVVILDAKSGEILTMIGSVDFFSEDIEGEVNSAISERNPGSTMKPFIYAYGMARNLTAATLINDSEQLINTFDGKYYFPRNYDRQEHGYATVREAIGNSLNIPAVVALKYTNRENGLDEFYQYLGQIGLEEAREQQSDIAAALGGFSVSLLDLVNAYRIFPNDGRYLGNPTPFIQDTNELNGEQVLGNYSSEIAYIMSNILDDEESRRREFGTLGIYNLPFPAAVKTGTTTDFRDSWTVGYTNDFLIGVWVGNNDNTQMYGVNGTIGAGEIWHDAMLITNKYYQGKSNTDSLFSKEVPSNVTRLDICASSGLIYDENCDSYGYSELFIKGNEPTNPTMAKKIDILDPDLIDIVSPANFDTYLYQEDLRIIVDIHSNSKQDKYILLLDREIYVVKEDDSDIFVNVGIGTHTLEIWGATGDNVFKSPQKIFYVESNEDQNL
jgi:membrane carboxypeptidase/penicillin-binding protein PbpC